MAALIDRRAFADHHALVLLGRGQLPSIDETRRRIFIAERRTDVGRPDHFYKGYLEERLGRAKHVGEIPMLVLTRLAERFLERRDGRVVVRVDRFVEWHELLPYISPLAVIVAFLIREGSGPRIVEDPRPFLAREIGETALIGPSDHALDDLVERKGLFELHMHLNGSTELDVLWPYACRDPDAFYKELADAWYENREPTAELYEQMEPGLTPLALYRRLRAVRRVRRQIAAEIACRIGASRQDPPIAWGIQGLLRAMEVDRSDLAWRAPLGASLRTHPGRVIHPGGPPHASIIEEAAFLYSCLLALVQAPDSVVGTGLYYNLLVLNQIGRIVVQQADETGFDQFQKYTFVGVRSGIERRYDMRFRQLNGRAPFDTLSHLEGRFAPKGTVAETRGLISTIVGDYLAFRGCKRREPDLSGPPPPCLLGLPCPEVGPRIGRRLPEGCRGHGRPGTELSLVAHFIKKPPKAALDRARGCRDSELRLSLLMQARALRRLLQGNQIACALVRGVDAASNELHAPPEPFAPAFRLARAAGIPRATFHVGEDFRHLVSGIRAVAEALTFLDLRSGDRIGHATALGITPNLWAARTAERTYLTVIDALDDAVFVHRRLAERGGYEREVLKLGDRIATLSGMLYGEPRSPALLHRAWELRRLDALEMRAAERAVSRSGRPLTAAAIADEAKRLATTTLDRQRASELALIAEEVAAAGCAYTIYAMRQRLGREAWQAKVEVEAELVSAEALVVLQDSVLGDVNRRGVAIEALPTSNTRISFYKTIREHHLFRWLGLEGPPLANRPTIVIGSDDPGIFATNLRNEYAAIAAVLRDSFAMSAPEAVRRIETLGDSARVFRFRPEDRT
ncbi:hypothetical protein MCBMB27_03687 [Methylobacterium phyllosphaerae]|uniref:Adenosine deaminase n=2 Tax=Methylobacterium TaxID=407 RepID=A0AAE8L839_9HYPH|nr:hypothetical protein [Methylobacterium phyllosphaerae]APT32978.1 hypothetical protein MCBMB27_03687 [Methylobacterium phyllosphaerae]SFH30148.1 hypothetical protein SAMN05192567_119111 [Methylobacterium phyllosphaerae]